MSPSAFPLSRALCCAALTIAPVLGAGAQVTNPNPPTTSWSAFVTTPVPSSDLFAPPECAGGTTSPVITTPASLNASCTLAGQGSGFFTTGLYTASALANATALSSSPLSPPAGVSARASLSGSGDGVRAFVSAEALFTEFVSVSGPGNIATAVLTSSYRSSGSSSSDAALGGSSNLDAYAISALDGSLDYIGSGSDNGQSYLDDVDRANTLVFNWGQVANNAFAYFVDASAFVAASDAGAGGIMASVFQSVPTLALFDADGNDVTSQFTISYSPGPTIQPGEITATPEPASMTLLGTGLAGLAGFARRRRARRSAV